MRQHLQELWADERGISSVEYAMLPALIAGGIIMGAEMLSGAVSNKITEAAAWLDDDACGNRASQPIGRCEVINNLWITNSRPALG